MTINGLKDFLKKKKDKDGEPLEFIYKDTPITKFSDKRISFDGGTIFRLASRVHTQLIMALKRADGYYSKRKFSKMFVREILDLIIYFISKKIEVVVCLDGARHPDKDLCRDERKEKRAKTKEKIRIAMEEYEAFLENPLRGGIELDIDKKLRKLRCEDFYFDPACVETLKETLDKLGIKHFTAEYEAEALCCSLEAEGKVAAVFTTDSDCYAFGIKNMIFEVDTRRDVCTVEKISKIVKYFMEEFDCTKKQAKAVLKDFCIMCGCDFNKRIAGLGPVGCFGHLQLCLSLKCFSHKDKKLLRYKECRKHLTVYETGLTEEDVTFDTSAFFTNYTEVLEEYDDDKSLASLFKICKKAWK